MIQKLYKIENIIIVAKREINIYNIIVNIR